MNAKANFFFWHSITLYLLYAACKSCFSRVSTLVFVNKYIVGTYYLGLYQMNRHAEPKQTNIGTQIRFGIYTYCAREMG